MALMATFGKILGRCPQTHQMSAHCVLSSYGVWSDGREVDKNMVVNK